MSRKTTVENKAPGLPFRPIAERMAANPEAYDFGNIREQLARNPEAEAPVQRMLGDFLPIPGMKGWYTREMTLRQEIELVDMADEMQALLSDLSAKPSRVMRVALPIAALILFRRNPDGDMMSVTQDEILDNFKAAVLLPIVREVSGFGAVASTPESPTPALPTTEPSFAG